MSKCEMKSFEASLKGYIGVSDSEIQIMYARWSLNLQDPVIWPSHWLILVNFMRQRDYFIIHISNWGSKISKLILKTLLPAFILLQFCYPCTIQLCVSFVWSVIIECEVYLFCNTWKRNVRQTSEGFSNAPKASNYIKEMLINFPISNFTTIKFPEFLPIISGWLM